MATNKSRSRNLAFPSDMSLLAEVAPCHGHGKGAGKLHGEAIRRGGVGRHGKKVRTPDRSPVKDAANEEMLGKPLSIKSIKKVAKEERRRLKEAAAHRYMEKVDLARKNYLRTTSKSRETYEKAKEAARDEMEQQVTHAKDKYQFTVEMARDIHEDGEIVAQCYDSEPPTGDSHYDSALSVEDELRQAVLGG